MDCIDVCGAEAGSSRVPGTPGTPGTLGTPGAPSENSLSAAQYMKDHETVYVMDLVHKGNIRRHRHDFYEFIFIERGFAIHNTRGGMSVLLPGDVVLIAPDEPHSYFNVHAQQLFNCLFKPAALDGFDAMLPLPLPEFLRDLGIKTHIGMDAREEMYRLLRSLTEETRGNRPGRNAKLKAQLVEALLLAWRCHAQRDIAPPSLIPHESANGGTDIPGGGAEAGTDACSDATSSAGPSPGSATASSAIAASPSGTYGYMSTGIVMRAIEYMQQEYANGINMQDVSSECGVTADYLAKLFRKACGIAPSEFLTSLRISSAMDLLQKTGRPVSDIALQVGYEDAAYFSRIFKKTVGTSPLQYRSGPAAGYGSGSGSGSAAGR